MTGEGTKKGLRGRNQEVVTRDREVGEGFKKKTAENQGGPAVYSKKLKGAHALKGNRGPFENATRGETLKICAQGRIS